MSSSPHHSLSLSWDLRPACSAWLGQIHSAEVAAYPEDEACTAERFQQRLEQAGSYFKCAVVNVKGGNKNNQTPESSSILGFVVGTLSPHSTLEHESMFAHDPQGQYLCIHSVCVVPLLQRQGLGKPMLIEYVRQVRAEQEVGHRLKAILLICKKNLIPFYESCGFKLIGASPVQWGKDQWYECRIDLEPTIPPMISSTSTTSVTPLESASSSAPIPIWLDCDPGHDDALAIILSGFSPKLRLLGLSTVAGNQSIEKTTMNARNVLNVAGLSRIAVHQGRENPIKRPGVQCPEIHGVSGLEGPHFPPLPVETRKATPAFQAMADVIQSSSEPITIVATGPLTNVALLVLTYPELIHPTKVKQIVLMGGAVGIGNTRPASEFNIEVDPEAAAIVFECGLPIVMVPLEVTHTALVTERVLSRIQNIGGGTPFSHFIGDLLLFFRDAYRDVFGFSSPPLHDPCAVAYLLRPEIFTCQDMRVDVECGSELCYGRTVCDVYGRFPNKTKNVKVALAMKVHEFWQLMIDALEKANRVSCLNTLKDGSVRYQPKNTILPVSIPHVAESFGTHQSEVLPLGAFVHLDNFPINTAERETQKADLSTPTQQ